MSPEQLQKALCAAFCDGVDVSPVASGYAVGSAFSDASGDRIAFYVTPAEDGFYIEDDGSYLAHLIAKDVPIDQGRRGQLLDAILSAGDAFWDRETFEIRTPVFPPQEVPQRAVAFLSSLIRVRDLELLTRDIVRSTFREDATRALAEALADVAAVGEGEAIDGALSDFPPDAVARPLAGFESAKPGAVYFVNSNDKLNEALLLKLEAERLGHRDFEVIALLEEPDMRLLSRKRFQRAQNRDVAMPIFRQDEAAAMTFIRRRLGFPTALAG